MCYEKLECSYTIKINVWCGVAGVTEEMATGGGENYLVVGLAVGIPCGVIILALLVAVVAIIVLLIWPSRYTER